MPLSWLALTEPPLSIRSHGTFGPSLAHCISHACPSHQPGAVMPGSARRQLCPTGASLPPMGQTRALACWTSAWPGLLGCLGNASAPVPLFLPVLTAFQGYSCCRLGMLLDFWQLFRRGSCFTPSSNDGICVQYQENVNFYKSLTYEDKVLQQQIWKWGGQLLPPPLL